MNTEWTQAELDRIGGVDEIGVSSRRPDGTFRPFVTIWAVRSGEDVFVRSAYGSGNPWFRRARAAGAGRVRVGDVDVDVAFEDVPAGARSLHEAVDAAYHAKYDRYGARIVDTVVGEHAHDVTLRLRRV